MTASDPRPVGEDDLHAFVDGRSIPAAAPPSRPGSPSTRTRRPGSPPTGRSAPACGPASPRSPTSRSRPGCGSPTGAPASRPEHPLAAGRRGGDGVPRPRRGGGLVGARGGAARSGAGRADDAGGGSAFRTYVVEAVHPVEVRADGTPHLEQWLSRRVGRPVRAPDLQAQGFRLMGGRLLPAGDEPAAMLMYDDDRTGTRLTLYSRAGAAGGRGVFRYAPRGRRRRLLVDRCRDGLRGDRAHGRSAAAAGRRGGRRPSERTRKRAAVTPGQARSRRWAGGASMTERVPGPSGRP